MSTFHRCRLCLKVSRNKLGIFKDDFPKMIEILTGIKVDPNDSFPKTSCLDCAKDVKSAMLIKKRIIRSHRILLEEFLAQSKLTSKTSLEVNQSSTSKVLVSNTGHNIQQNLDQQSCTTADSKPVNELNSKSLPYVAKTEIIKESEQEKTSYNVKTESTEADIDSDISNEGPASPTSSNIEKVTVTKKPVKRRKKLLDSSKSKSNIKASDGVFFVKKRTIHSTRSKKKKTEIIVRIKKKPKGRSAIIRIPCDVCKKEVRSTWMQTHLETHNYNPVTCEFCGATSKNSSALRHHVFYYHKSTADKYMCDKCGRHFRSRYRLTLHNKKEHGGTKDFECTICGKRFFERMHLKRHVDEIHKNLRPHICNFCGKTFKKRAHLIVHNRIHTKEAPHTCHMCGESFKMKLTLRNHLKGIHNVQEEEKVFCQICNRGFVSNIALRAHSRLHDGQKCQYCSKIFSGEYMNNHLRDVHGMGIEMQKTEDIY